MNTELEEMRMQMNLLKTRLERETIVSQRLMRRAMKEQMGFVMLPRKKISIGIVLLGCVFLAFQVFDTDFSLKVRLWNLLLLVICLSAVSFNLYAFGSLKKSDFLTLSLVELRRKLYRLYRLKRYLMIYSLAATAAILAVCMWQFEFPPVFLGLLFAVTALGIWIEFHRMNRIRNVLGQIEELTDNDIPIS